MDNKATTKRMIGAVVLVLVAALLLAWLLKGKNRDGQQDMAMNQTGETKPILGFPGVGDDAQKPSIVGDDPNAAAQAGAGQAGIDVSQQQAQGAVDPTQQAAAGQGTTGNNLIPGIEVKLPETVANTTGFEVRPVGAGGEVRDLVDTDGKVKDGEGSLGTGDSKATPTKAGDKASDAAPASAGQGTAGAGSADKAQLASAPAAAPTASQQNKAASTKDAAPAEKKASSKVVLVNEKPVPKATSEDSAKAAAAKAAAANKAAADKAASVKKEAEEKAAAIAKAAADKAAAAKSLALANAKPGAAVAGTGAATANAGAGGFIIQVLASSDKAKADAAAAPLKADGYNVTVSTATVGGKPIYRVNVGGFANRAEADAAQAKMKLRYKQNQAIQGSFVTSSK